MANYNLGTVTGEIRMDYDGKGVREAKQDIRDLGDENVASSKKITKSNDDSGKSVASFRKQFADLGKDIKNSREGIDTFGKVVGALGNIDPTGMAGLATQVATLGVAVVPAAGALAILPGAALVAASAFAVTKIATAGMGDAFKAVAEGDAAKLDEALKKLSPEAQNVVKEYARIKPVLDSLKLDVQNAFWKDNATILGQLANTYLPGVHTGFVAIAAQMGSMVGQSAKALMAPETVAALNVVLASTASFFRELGPAVGNFVSGLINVGGAGAKYLPAIATYVGGIAQAFDEWAKSAQGQQQINRWIQEGASVLKQLWIMLINVAQIAINLFKPLEGGSQGFLANLNAIIAKVTAWSATAEGQQSIANIWNLLSVFGNNLVTTVSLLMPLILSIANAFAGLPAPVQQTIGLMATWSSVLGLVIGKLSPLIGFLIQVGPILMKLPTLISGVTTAFRTMMTGFKVMAAVMSANPWILLIGALIVLAVLIYTHWDAIYAFLVATWAKITAVWNTFVAGIISIGTSVWQTISTAWNTAINAITSFFSSAWTTVTSIWNSVITTITSIGSTVWQTISSAWTAAITAITAFFASQWANVTALWSNLMVTIVAIGSSVWETIKTIWYAAILSIWAILTGQWDLLGTIWSTFIQKIVTIGSNLWTTISGIWSSTISTIVSNISNFVSQVGTFISNLVTTVTTFFSNLGSNAKSTWDSFIAAIVAKVTIFVATVISFISNLAAQFVAKVTIFVATVISYFSNLASQGPAKISQMVSSMLSSASNLASSFVSSISSMVSRAISSVSSMASSMVSTLAGLPGRMASIGASIISGIISGISGAAGRLFSYLGSLAAQALASAKAAFGIGSPSKLFADEIGREIPAGIEVGIIQTAQLATGAAADLAAAVSKAASQEVAVKLGSVSEEMWNKLLDMGFKGRADDNMEALYVPSDVLSKLTSLGGAQQAQVASLAANARTLPGSTGLGASQFPYGTTSTESCTITVDNLNINVQGVVDPTDPVAWRRFGEQVRDLIRDVEVSYR